MDFVPEVSAIDTDVIEVDAETKAMLRSLDMGNLQASPHPRAGNSTEAQCRANPRRPSPTALTLPRLVVVAGDRGALGAAAGVEG